MYTVVLNKRFQVVDVRRGRPRAEGREFEISEQQYVKLRKVGDLNNARGYPRFKFDSASSQVVEVEDGQ